MVKCINPGCGAELDPGARFCGECGTAVPESTLCPSCYAAVGAQDSFCSACGQRLDQSEQTADAPAAVAPGSNTILRLQGHSGNVNGIAFTPDGRLALSASDDGSIRLWNPRDAQEVGRLEGGYGPVYSVTVSPDGALAFAGISGAVCVWDLETRREIQRYGVPMEFTTSISLSADGKYALTGGGEPVFHLWEVATGREVRIFEGHGDLVQAVALSPDGRLALSAAIDNMRLWEVESGRELNRFDDVVATQVAEFSPDGRYFLSGGVTDAGEDVLILWDARDSKEVRRFIGHTDQSVSAAFSADGRSIVSGSYDTTVRLWRTADGIELDRHLDHSELVRSVAYSPDGERVLSGGGGTYTGIYDFEEGQDHALRMWNLGA